ncbi:glycosyltransferase [Enterococcus asini]|uniref:glycosyltransferase n=1 Tax=Enterococcus asini TaxID=57732 RepID=UPI00288D2818|nr:glycosyltransferase [Enterococcus asini]MDT2756579.1 glycosyltransferase [Enterococcus asini]
MDKKIYIVLVLYKQKWQDVPSRVCLENLIRKEKGTLLIYDNSPAKQSNPFFLETHVTYVHDASNPGLAVAYNKALAAAADFDWLILLDQDTAVTSAYFEEINNTTPDEQVAALVPLIFSGNQQISPVYSEQYIGKGAKHPHVGVHTHVMAINSASVLRIAFLKEVGGFNQEFSLDFLDHWLYWRIQKEGMQVQVLKTVLVHDLSVLDYDTLDFSRYESILIAERRYYSEYAVALKKQHQNHLLKRTLKQFLTVKNRRFWKRTFNEWRQLLGGKR